jgi:hypothetical protein
MQSYDLPLFYRLQRKSHPYLPQSEGEYTTIEGYDRENGIQFAGGIRPDK